MVSAINYYFMERLFSSLSAKIFAISVDFIAF